VRYKVLTVAIKKTAVFLFYVCSHNMFYVLELSAEKLARYGRVLKRTACVALAHNAADGVGITAF
jgi:hypothetical protein